MSSILVYLKTKPALGLIVLFLQCGLLWAEPPVIEVRSITPAGGTIGSSLDLRLTSGSMLDEVERLEFSHAGIRATLKQGPSLPFDDSPQKLFGQFTVQIDPNVPEGRYELWAVGRNGISNPRSFLVTRAAQNWTPSTSTHATPTALSIGSIVGSFTRAQELNHYTLHLEEGEELHLKCFARNIESKAIPTLVLTSASGKEIGRARATGAASTTLDWIATSAGDFHLTVRDFLYRGGDEYGYLLARTTREDPLAELDQQPIDPSALSFVHRDDLPKIEHVETPAQSSPMTIPIPSEVLGMFDKTGDEDSFEFSTTTGQSIQCDIFSSALGQLTDPRIIVEKITKQPDGSEKKETVLTNDEENAIGSRAMSLSSLDPHLVLPNNLEGTIRITLVDMQSGSRPQGSTNYVLRLKPTTPSFEAIAYWPFPTNNPPSSRPFGSIIRRGGNASLRVSVIKRGGFDIPIEISANELPAGITAKSSLIAPGQTDTELILSAAEDAAEWTGTISIVARYKQGDADLEKRVHPATIAIASSTERGLPQSQLCNALWLNVSSRDLAPISLQPTSPDIVKVAPGAKIALPITVVRRTGGEAKCVLRAQNLPPKCALPDIEVGPNAVSPEIQIAADTPAGEYTLWFQAEMTMKHAINPESHLRAVAYRDKLQTLLADPQRASEKTSIEMALAEANKRVEQLAKETAPRDFPTFFSTSPFRIQVAPPTPQP